MSGKEYGLLWRTSKLAREIEVTIEKKEGLDCSPIIHARHAFGKIPPASVAGNVNVWRGPWRERSEKRRSYCVCTQGKTTDGRWEPFFFFLPLLNLKSTRDLTAATEWEETLSGHTDTGMRTTKNGYISSTLSSSPLSLSLSLSLSVHIANDQILSLLS
uniref:Bm591 n=1 Tax=Brugia malayi TaxID=6279 RepID=A0A1I9G3V8_BRUMA|nr:Bm591 [Brugia malayi]